MSKRKPLVTLTDTEYIIAVVPETRGGEGWSYTPLWVYIMDGAGGAVRAVAIHPSDQTDAMLTLFGPGEAMCRALVGAVNEVTVFERGGWQ